MNFKTKLKNYHSASYSALFVTTHEERRVTKEIRQYSMDTPGVNIHEWDCQNGLHWVSGDNETAHPDLTNPLKLLEYLQSLPEENSIFILKDFHRHINDALIVRMLRNSWLPFKSRGNLLLMTGYKYSVQPELEKEIQLLDYELPGVEHIKKQLQFIVASVNHAIRANNPRAVDVVLPPDVEEKAIEAARGMTSFEIENAFALAYAENNAFDARFVDSVFDEKISQLKKDGLLTYLSSDVSFENVGGMNVLKEWLLKRRNAYGKKAEAYGLPLPKGVLLASVPGVGKTLIAKALAKEFGCPLFYLDISKVFASLVGESEHNMRQLIKTIEAIGKCVLIIDEIEKSLSNDAVSGRGDTGVSSRVFGTFLSWLNDRKNPAFIVATTNNHTILPPALIRKGRFDQMFWIDLPNTPEREDIVSVVIKKYNRSPEDFAVDVIAEETRDFTGAEIEEVFKDSLFKAFSLDREITVVDIKSTIKEFIPFSKSNADDLQKMRESAKGKLVIASSPVKEKPQAKAIRKLSIDT